MVQVVCECMWVERWLTCVSSVGGGLSRLAFGFHNMCIVRVQGCDADILQLDVLSLMDKTDGATTVDEDSGSDCD